MPRHVDHLKRPITEVDNISIFQQLCRRCGSDLMVFDLQGFNRNGNHLRHRVWLVDCVGSCGVRQYGGFSGVGKATFKFVIAPNVITVTVARNRYDILADVFADKAAQRTNRHPPRHIREQACKGTEPGPGVTRLPFAR